MEFPSGRLGAPLEQLQRIIELHQQVVGLCGELGRRLNDLQRSLEHAEAPTDDDPPKREPSRAAEAPCKRPRLQEGPIHFYMLRSAPVGYEEFIGVHHTSWARVRERLGGGTASALVCSSRQVAEEQFRAEMGRSDVPFFE